MDTTCACGAGNPASANFCRSCGRRVGRGRDTLRVNLPVTPLAQPEEPPPPAFPPPPDFELSLYEDNGSVAPQFRVSTRVTVSSSQGVRVDRELGEGPLKLTATFPVDEATVAGLYGLVVRHKVLTREWRETYSAEGVGSGACKVSARGNGVVVTSLAGSADVDEHTAIRALVAALRALIPPQEHLRQVNQVSFLRRVVQTLRKLLTPGANR